MRVVELENSKANPNLSEYFLLGVRRKQLSFPSIFLGNTYP